MGIDDEVGEDLLGFGRLQPTEGIDEAEAVGFDSLSSGGLEHHQPDEIVDQHEYLYLFHHHVDAASLENVQAESDLEVAQIYLGVPGTLHPKTQLSTRMLSRVWCRYRRCWNWHGGARSVGRPSQEETYAASQG